MAQVYANACRPRHCETDAIGLFRSAVLRSVRWRGRDIFLWRTRRKQAVQRAAQSFGGEFPGMNQPAAIGRKGSLGEIELRQVGKRLDRCLGHAQTPNLETLRLGRWKCKAQWFWAAAGNRNRGKRRRSRDLALKIQLKLICGETEQP